jgi:hypothetical protein
VLDDVQNKVYPMPLEAEGKDEVFVGRIRRDLSQPKNAKPVDCCRQPQKRRSYQRCTNCRISGSKRASIK